jgi:hypothetical protein
MATTHCGIGGYRESRCSGPHAGGIGWHKPDSAFEGEIELHESYLGGRRKGIRGRGAAGKIRVFGLLKRGPPPDLSLRPKHGRGTDVVPATHLGPNPRLVKKTFGLEQRSRNLEALARFSIFPIGGSLMKKLGIIATSLLFATPVIAQSVGEKSGVNSALGVSPSTADFVKEAAISDMFEIQSSQSSRLSGRMSRPRPLPRR